MFLLNLSLLSLTYALAGSGFVALPVQRTVSNTSANNTIVKRDYVEGSATNYKVTYIATVELGNPGQPQQVALDTGSSDLWVWGNNSGASTTYNPALSSDSHYINDGFRIGYVSGDSVTGDYYNDTFSWGGIDCTLEFAVASHYATGDTSDGILGISYENIEGDSQGRYSNLPVALKEQGIINTVAYSLYLDDYDADSGTVLFGAVDTSKFDGKLTVIDCSTGTSVVPLTIDGQQTQSNLDSGTSLAYIPESILNPIIQKNWAGQLTYDSSWRLYRLNAADRPEGTITFTFNDVNITLGPEQLWIKLAHNAWYLGIGTSESIGGDTLLGDVFLRSAYVVYDLEHSRIAIAPAKYDSSSPDYQAIVGTNIPGSS